MALKNFAQSPLFENASGTLARAGSRVQKVPVRFWRMLVIALAAIWVCHILANIFWVLFPAPELPTPTVVAAQPMGDSGPASNVDIEYVQSLNLFGDFNAEAVVEAPAEPTPEPVRRTQLNLELQGVIAASDPERSWAIIGRSSSDQRLYGIGDEIRGVRGVKIARVHDLRVVLDNNGTLEELWLYGEDGTRIASSAPPPPPPSRSRSDEPSEDEPRTATVSADQIQGARNIGDVVRFMVHTEEGRMVGYRVRPGRQRELFDQVGLENDDIVVSVNGIEVNEPQKVREVYQSLKTASEANLQVLRDGATHYIQITMSSEG